MRSSLISRLLFLSSTSLLGCCGDDTCGPAGAPASGLVAGSDMVTLTFGALEGGLNHDCPDAANPDLSMTISGTQTDGTGIITLCVPRVDQLAKQKLALGLDVGTSEVRIIDVIGSAANCTFSFDRTIPPTGTMEAGGLCNNGSDPSGFALTVDGAISLARTCGSTVDKVSVTLRGRVAVATPQ